MSTDVSLPAASFLNDARETFLRWERLRLVYNAVLIALTCVVVFSQRPDAAWQPDFIAHAVLAALAANVCYLAGPVVETYLHWLGMPTRVLTSALFGAGMLFSCLITLAACFSFLHGDKV